MRIDSAANSGWRSVLEVTYQVVPEEQVVPEDACAGHCGHFPSSAKIDGSANSLANAGLCWTGLSRIVWDYDGWKALRDQDKKVPPAE